MRAAVRRMVTNPGATVGSSRRVPSEPNQDSTGASVASANTPIRSPMLRVEGEGLTGC